MTRKINRPVPPPGMSSKLGSVTPNALDTPERVLNYCRDRGFISPSGALDVEALIESDPQLMLIKRDLGDVDALIKKSSSSGNKYEIHVNSKHAKSRQRFSMAHEFAHYHLHRDHLDDFASGEKIMFRDGERNQIEYQANRFAASILMPESSVLKAYNAAKFDKVMAANMLGVSLMAFEFRVNGMSIE